MAEDEDDHDEKIRLIQNEMNGDFNGQSLILTWILMMVTCVMTTFPDLWYLPK